MTSGWKIGVNRSTTGHDETSVNKGGNKRKNKEKCVNREIVPDKHCLKQRFRRVDQHISTNQALQYRHFQRALSGNFTLMRLLQISQKYSEQIPAPLMCTSYTQSYKI
jgi:hypothetical protein